VRDDATGQRAAPATSFNTAQGEGV